MKIPTWITGSVVLAASFAAGLGTGIGCERRHERSHHAVTTDGHSIIHRLAVDLNLDPAQQEAIGRILARHQSEIDSAWRSMQPHVHATLDSALQEIAGVLRPDQAAKFRSLTAGHSRTPH